MAYTNKTFRFRNAIEVEEYHNGRYGAPGQKRVKKEKATPEQIKKINQYNKEKRCRRKLREHFDVHDYYICITYEKDKRPENMDEAKSHFTDTMKELRKAYKKAGVKAKWIRNIEVGTRGAWHTHMVLNRIPDLDIILSEAWTHGRVKIQLLYERGEFRELAAYMTKTPDTEPRLKEASYSASRNLPIQEPEAKKIKWKTWRKIKVPEGFYLDPDSFYEGINPVTGYKYRTYTLLRIRRIPNVSVPQSNKKKNQKRRNEGNVPNK